MQTSVITKKSNYQRWNMERKVGKNLSKEGAKLA